jgi:hypothetical protein
LLAVFSQALVSTDLELFTERFIVEENPWIMVFAVPMVL